MYLDTLLSSTRIVNGSSPVVAATAGVSTIKLNDSANEVRLIIWLDFNFTEEGIQG